MLWTRCCAVAGLIVVFFSLAAFPSRGDERKGPTPAESQAAALVRQALDNEVAGDGAARDRLLREAALVAPDYAPARWHLGHVRAGKAWVEAAAAMAEEADSPIVAKYQVRRDEAAGNSALELKLAQWCLKEQMPDRARLHFWQVLANPKASKGQIEDAARQLDLVFAGGKILTRDELKKEQEREKAIAEAIAKYRPVLAQYQPAIDGGFGEQHDVAAAKLAAINDPSVIAAIETYLSSHREGFGEELMKLLAKFPQVESTQTLVRYAVMSPYLGIRELATTELKLRPLHDYVPTLLAGLIAPLQSQYQFQRDSRGNIRYQQVFIQEKADATLVRYLEQLYRPQTAVLVGSGGSGVRAAASFNARSNYLIQSDIANEIARLELLTNAAKLAANQNNGRVIDVLTQVTGQQLRPIPQEWWSWWQEYNQVHYPKPTYQLYAYSVQPYLARAAGISCFVKGTVVWTEQGLRPIELIQPGDRVLSQDPDIGELTFKLVTGKTVRPPADASTLTVLGESITTTLGHPLWVTGQGWEMAKHVKPGDQLHGVHGILVASAIDPLPNKIEAHNLVVEDFGTYFVGNCGLLVHDNTYRQPTRAVVPGLTP